MTQDEFLATQFPSLAGWIRTSAVAGVGSRVHAADGVIAQVSPEIPDASLFNSVTYRDTAALRVAVSELAWIYDEAGVRAWTVWVHESDFEAAKLLQEAGHTLDSSPEGMGCALDELIAPEGIDGLDYTDAPAVEEVQLVLSRGYGFPLRVSRHATGNVPSGPDTIVAVARIEGRPACTAQVTVSGQDAGVYAVATIPEARGRGLARRLQYVLLQGARELGARTTTLQASKTGRSVYASLGYQSFGAMNMWERRRPKQEAA